MHDHRALGEREGEEHADREQRDQRLGLTVEGDVDHGRGDGEHEDAVAEREAIAHAQEEPRDVAVASHEVQQPREAVERRVRGDQQDKRGRQLHEAIGNAVADAGMRDLGEHRLAATRGGAVEVRDEHDADEHRDQQPDHDARASAGRASPRGGRNTGTAFEITSIPVIAVAPDANARSTSRTPSASVAR